MGLVKDIKVGLELEMLKVLLRIAAYKPMTYVNISKEMEAGKQNVFLKSFQVTVMFISEIMCKITCTYLDINQVNM